jgi:NTP pyrophosphatase (non-canonical NTP hydrolase)
MVGFLDMTREDKSSRFLKAAGKTQYNENEEFDKSMTNNFIEESTELLQAINDYLVSPSNATRANLCKEWADAQVTLSNIAWYFRIPADPALNRVTRNNDSKIVDGVVKFREDGKVLKPDNYQPVDMRGL